MSTPFKVVRHGNNNFIIDYPLAASTTITHGYIVGVNAAGYLSGAPTLLLGVATETKTSIGIGDVKVKVESGYLGFQNGTNADALTIGDIGDPVYLISGNTVGKTNGGGTRLAAGTLVNIEQSGLLVVKIGI